MKDGARSRKFILNPEAKIFKPRIMVYNAIMPDAEMGFLTTSCETHTYVLNSSAKSFVPRYALLRENCGIIAIFVTLLLLFILFLIHLKFINNNDDMSSKNLLKKMKHEYPNKIMIGHLNINSIRSKFEYLKDIIENNIDVFLISVT